MSCASTVDAPRCGVTTTLSCANSGMSAVGSIGEDVERRAPDVPALERLGERVLVDDAAARGVHEPRARLHQRQLVLADQPLGLGRARQVDRRRSRPGPGAPRAWASRRRPSPSRARRSRRDRTRSRACRTPAARGATSAPTRPRPTSPIVLPASSTPSHFERSHAACLQRGVGLRDVASLREEQRHRLLGGADRRWTGARSPPSRRGAWRPRRRRCPGRSRRARPP